jgi:hypothetical protein
MPWLGDGTWVDNPGLARDIVQGRTNYRPWSGNLSTATPRERRMTRTTEKVEYNDENIVKLAEHLTSTMNTEMLRETTYTWHLNGYESSERQFREDWETAFGGVTNG